RAAHGETDQEDIAFGKIIEGRDNGNEMVKRWIAGMKGDKTLEEILLEGIKELPKKIEKLNDAVQRNIKSDIKFIAHDIKGSSGNLRMKEIYDVASKINNEILEDDYSIQHIRMLFNNLKKLVEEIPRRYLLKTVELKASREKITSGFKILVAEDNEINKKLIKTFIDSMGLVCDVAENGKVTLEMLKKNKYDLLFLDMQMPVMDGEDTIKAIRGDTNLKGLHVIALTANAMKGDAEKCINLGCDDYLSKPIDRRLLNEKINTQLINKYSRHAESSAYAEKQALNDDEKSFLRDILEELKKNISIFNPKKISSLADKLDFFTSNDQVMRLRSRMLKAAESFDDQALKEIVQEFEKLL
ncbi:MAG: response regulator, partial [Spirochaetota bacterium]